MDKPNVDIIIHLLINVLMIRSTHGKFTLSNFCIKDDYESGSENILNILVLESRWLPLLLRDQIDILKDKWPSTVKKKVAS